MWFYVVLLSPQAYSRMVTEITLWLRHTLILPVTVVTRQSSFRLSAVIKISFQVCEAVMFR